MSHIGSTRNRSGLSADHGKVLDVGSNDPVSVFSGVVIVKNKTSTMATRKWHNVCCPDDVTVVLTNKKSTDDVQRCSCSNCETSPNHN